MDNQLIIRIKNDLSELEKIIQQFDVFSAQNRLPVKIKNAVDLVIDEIINNIITYGYDDDEEHYIDVTIFIKDEMLNLEIEDDAGKFNPLNETEPDTESSIEKREIGGLGLHFLKNMMDEVIYKYINKKNNLNMRKQIKES
jgi:anti-sigma regulatory factor (Ser/Thr protein kinase)